jgi:branched-chain amino acid transport system permease protein
MVWTNAVVQGILLGGMYALLAAGLSLMFGVMRIVNLAHGVLAMAAAYLGLVVIEHLGFNVWAAIPVVVIIAAGVGYLLQRPMLNRALAKGGLAPILVTFGLAVVGANLLQEGFSVNPRSLAIGDLGIRSLRLGAVTIGYFPLITFVIGVLAIVAIQLFIAYTPLGRAMRAASDDPETVELMGIKATQVYALAAALAVAAVGLAGMFLGMRTQFNPGLGDTMLIFAFEVVIIGGLGSLWGTLVGGIVLGIAQTVGAQWNPAYGLLVGHVVFLLVLLLRPSGLLPKSVTAS